MGFVRDFRFSHEVAVEVQISEGLTRARGSASKMMHSHSWLGAGCWWEASVLCDMDLLCRCKSVFNDMAVGFPRENDPRSNSEAEMLGIF